MVVLQPQSAWIALRLRGRQESSKELQPFDMRECIAH